jgi:hypothetical protein
MNRQALALTIAAAVLPAMAHATWAAEPATADEVRALVGRTLVLRDGRKISLTSAGNYLVHRSGKSDLVAKYSLPSGNILLVTWRPGNVERYTVYREGNTLQIINAYGRKAEIASNERIDVDTTAAIQPGQAVEAQKSVGAQARLVPLTKDEVSQLVLGKIVRLQDGRQLSFAAGGSYLVRQEGKPDVRASFAIPAGNIVQVHWSYSSFDSYLLYKRGESYVIIDKFGRKSAVERISSM